MRLINKIPGKNYFISILFIGTILFTTFSAVIYRNYKDVIQLNEWVLDNYEFVRQVRLLTFALVDMETGVRGYLLTGQNRFLNPYEEARGRIPDYIQNLRSLMKENQSLHAPIYSWLGEIEPFTRMLEEQVKKRASSRHYVVSVEELESQRTRMDSLRDLTGDYINEKLAQITGQIESSKEQQRDFRYILLVGTILAIGAMLLATLIILSLLARNQLAEEEAMAAADRWMTIMNGINDGVFDYNITDNSIYYSPSYKSMLGYKEDEFENTVEHSYQLIHPDDFDEVMAGLERYKKRESDEYRNTYRIRHKDGSWHWILSRGVGIWNKNGELTRLIGTHTDVTQERQREEDLRQLNNDLESFTYITSHDLRSPLVNLKGFTGEIEYAIGRIRPIVHEQMKALDEEKKKILSESFDTDIPEALEFIEKSVEKMDTLTTAVLDLSRIGKHEFRYEKVMAGDIVRKCLDAMAFEINKSDIEIVVGALPVIYSDPLALEQIFSNLLDNAVKYLQPGRRGRIVIAAKESDRDVVFSIEDNGRGIDEKDRQKIFEIFRRARNSGDVRGLGMGMAFVKATLRKMHGAVWFESQVGKGTTFYFQLPKQQPKG